MIVILTATKEEYRLVLENLKGYTVVRMGVGASNVIHTLTNLHFPVEQCHFINVGFCGSNHLQVGTVAKVARTFRLKDETVEFEDYRNGEKLSEDGYDCYTSNSFVTKSTSDSPVLYDMELNYIAAFPYDLLGAVKIVSDNLDVIQYETTIDTTSVKVWSEVKKIVDEIASKIK